MIKLVLSDMDNTLIPLGQRVSPRTVEAIHAVLDAGVRFGPATGRDYVELSRLFRMHEECFMTGIFSNGKRVRLDGRYVSTTLIPHDQLVRIDQAIRGEKGMFLVCFPEETNLMNPAYGVGVSSAGGDGKLQHRADDGREGDAAGLPVLVRNLHRPSLAVGVGGAVRGARAVARGGVSRGG